MAMVPQISIDEALTALAMVQNETTTPNEEKSRRMFFIASAVERLYRAFDFDTARLQVDVTTNADGIADLSDLNLGIIPAIFYVGDGTEDGRLDYISSDDAHLFGQGDRKFWVGLNEDGDYELHTTEPSATYSITYIDSPDIRTLKVTFTPMVIAKGALIYQRAAGDPEADTSVEEDAFRQEVSEIIEMQNRRRPQQFARTQRDVMGHNIGRT